MKTLFFAVFALVLLGGVVAGQDEKDNKEKPVVGALAPHPLDDLFGKAKSEAEVIKALEKHPVFQKALKEAMKAKQDAEAELKKNPRIIGVVPAQAARVRFLEVLLNQKREKD